VSQAVDGENWLSVRTTVRLLTSDNGILDPDDYVCDVIDDREQVSTVLSSFLRVYLYFNMFTS